MLYTKPIENITYEDVVDFCNERRRENMYLDYKRDISESLTKTIAAMANTWGGHIIIGVEEEDSRPKLPVSGMPYRERLREQVNDLVLGNITPPLLLEVQVCLSGDGKSAFVIIRVPQSNLTPHAIENNTKVYLRTDTCNKPEEQAGVDRVLWLVEKRNKSIKLKDSFYARAGERFNFMCKKEQSEFEYSDVFWGVCPLYPFDILTDFLSFQRDILRGMYVSGWGMYFPRRIGELNPAQDGGYAFSSHKTSQHVLYEEINRYGFFYHREELGYAYDKGSKTVAHITGWRDLLTRTDLLLEWASQFYMKLGYWGLVEIKITLSKLNGVAFVFSESEKEETCPIDRTIEISRTFSGNELKENRVSMVKDLMSEISWAIGFPFDTSDTIELHMKKAGRI